MVAFYVPKAVVSSLEFAGLGEAAANDLHVTLAQVDDPTDEHEQLVLRIVEDLADAWGPTPALISGLGRFKASTLDGKDVWYASVDSDPLTRFRQLAFDRMDAEGLPLSREHGFIPHITLAILEPDEPTPSDRWLEEPVPIIFRSIAVKRADNAPAFFPLSIETRVALNDVRVASPTVTDHRLTIGRDVAAPIAPRKPDGTPNLVLTLDQGGSPIWGRSSSGAD